MTRPHVEFIFAQNLAWRDAATLSCHAALGARGEGFAKLLSVDAATGEASLILRLPPGFEATLASPFAEELYLLDGALRLGDSPLARDCYARLPAGDARHWRSEEGVTLLLFLDLPEAADDRAAVLLDPTTLAWDRAQVPAELAWLGITLKILYADANSGRMRTWLLSTPPQIAPRGLACRVETHSCDEEVFMLAGDITGPLGVMTAGAYFWRPRDTDHGPFGSRSGSLALSRFRNGVQDTVFHPRLKPFSFDAPYRPILPDDSVEGLPPTPSDRY